MASWTGRILAVGLMSLAVSGVARADVFDIFTVLQNYGTQKLAAAKVLTSQISLAGTTQINADIALTQGAVAARALLSTASDQIDTYRSYSALTGQGAQVCDAVNQRNDVDDIARSREAYAFTEQRSNGRAAVPRDRYEAGRIEKSLDAYCSADENNLGICKSRFDGMQSASSNYTKISLADQFTTKQLRAAGDFISNLVPPPMPARRAGDCDAACKAQQMRALRADAMASMVAVPLAASMSNRIGQKTFADKK